MDKAFSFLYFISIYPIVFPRQLDSSVLAEITKKQTQTRKSHQGNLAADIFVFFFCAFSMHAKSSKIKQEKRLSC